MTRLNNARIGLFSAVVGLTVAALLTASACGKDEKKNGNKGPATGGSSSNAEAESVSLTWDPPDDPSKVASYKIYVASDEDSDGELVATVKTSTEDFDADSPAFDLDIEGEKVLEDLLGENACFSVTALDAAGAESTASDTVCVDL